MDLNNLPEELTRDRDSIECTFVFSLYKDTDYVDVYKYLKPNEDIFTECGIFYYELALKLYEAGYKNFDNISIFTFLESHPEWKTRYEEWGGFQTIQSFTEIIDPDNIEVYFKNLEKSNLMISLFRKGYPIQKHLEKFSEMDSEQISSYMDQDLSKVLLRHTGRLEIEDLSRGYDPFIEGWNQGNDIGFNVGIKELNSRLLGIHKKNFMLHVGGIGSGKTSTAIAWYILPAIKQGVNVCVMANEQDEDAWRKMLASTVLNGELGVELDRRTITRGNFDQETINKLKMVEKWMCEQPGKISFVDFPSYDIAHVKKIVKTQSARGYELFILDTMKNADDSADNAWGLLSEMAKDLFQLSKNKDIAMLATCQLAPDAINRKYLDLTAISRARQISEVANSVVMFRHMTDKEKTGDAEVFTFAKDKFNAPIMGSAQKENLDPNKDYMVIFTGKNRYGAIDPQIVVESDLNVNTYKFVGYYKCPHDDPRKKP